MGGAKQVVYVITDGMPTDVSATTKAAAEVRKVARLAFIPVGDDYLVTGFGDFPGMNAWASKPTSENVFYAKDFKKLETQLQKAVVSTCKEDKPEKVICQSQGKVPMDVSIIIDGSGSVGNDGWDYSVKAAKRMAGSFGAATRVSAAVFSTGFDWLTQNPKAKKTPCPDTPGCSPDVKKNPSWCTKSGSPNYWQHNRKTCPGTCKTGAKCKVDDAFATPAEAEKAIAGAKFPKGATATAGALDRVLSLIKTRGAKGATQIVYFITDGEPNSPNQHTAVSETTKEAAKLRKAARLIFIPFGKGAPLSRMKTWASTPTSENVFYAKDFKALKHQLTKAVKSSCGKVKESKTKAAEEKKTKEEAEKISKSREKDKKKEKAAKKKEVADKAAKKEKKAKADEKASKEAKKKVAEKTKKIKEKETKKGVLCQPETKPGKVAVDVTIVIDGSGSVGTNGWGYSVNAATKMASSFGLGSRVSAAVFSNSFRWLTQGPFTTPDKAAAAIKKAYFPRGSTNTANALTKTLSHIKSRGSKGAKQIVYVITDGRPNSEHRTATAASKVRKVARLAFIPVGTGAPVSKMKSWASKPTSANVFYAKDFKALSHQLKKAVKSTC